MVETVAGDRLGELQDRCVEGEDLGLAHLVGQFAECPQRQQQASEGQQQATPAQAQEGDAEARVLADRIGDPVGGVTGFLLLGFLHRCGDVVAAGDHSQRRVDAWFTLSRYR